MSSLKNYEFTIDDFEKHITISGNTIYNVKLNVVKQINNMVYFQGQYTLIDSSLADYLQEDLPELYNDLKSIMEAHLDDVCIIANFSFYISINSLIEAFNRDDHTILNNDASDIQHELVKIFYSIDGTNNNTEKVISITNQSFANTYLKEVENFWKYLINVEKSNNSTILSFENPELCGLKFSSDFCNTF